MRHRSRLLGMCLGVVAALVLAACAADEAAEPAVDEEEPIIIGAAIAQTGFVEAYDASPMLGLEIAIDDINDDGGILGRPLEIVTSDTKSEIELGAQAGLEVLEAGADLVVVSADFDWGSPAARPANDREIPVFSLFAATGKFGPVGIGPYAYTIGNCTCNEAAVVAEFAYNEQEYRSVYILDDPTLEYTQTFLSSFKERWTELAGEDSIVGEDTFENQDPSIASQITRYHALADEPDFILFNSYPPGAAAALRQIRAAGIDVPIVGNDTMGGGDWRDAVPNLSDLYYVGTGSMEGDDPNEDLNRLIEEARRRIEAGEGPVNDETNLFNSILGGYSIMEALKIAAERAGSTDGPALKEQFDAFDNEPLVIGTTTFTPELHLSVNRSLAIIGVGDGKDFFVTRFTAEKVPDPEL